MVQELRKRSEDELKIELTSSLREQFNLRIQKSQGDFDKPHLLRQVRKKIARIKTVLTELEEGAVHEDR